MKQSSPSQIISLLKKIFVFIIVQCIGISVDAQIDENYSILVAGHAYGAHIGTNMGLHPLFLSKLHENNDIVSALFLTGDIVNTSTTAAWAQVEKELADLKLTSYYIMGNHDNNTIGKAVFNAKHGGLYYSFSLNNDLYIILNSTESDRSISAAQLAFLEDVLQKATTSNKKVFIFMHEVIWNSNEKYRLVRSNSRSRYDQIKGVSNFWQKVVPILDTYPAKKFYLFTGDVGGNPDAVAAFYDRWDNMIFLSSGMGEVADENYMRVNISPDTVTFSLIALSKEVQMHPIAWYTVPLAPEQIKGPAIVKPPVSAVKYEASPVFNATSYRWNLSSGMSGNSDSTVAELVFGDLFQKGEITVRAVNDGFGESEPVRLTVQSSDYTSVTDNKVGKLFSIQQDQHSIHVKYTTEKSLKAQLRIYDLSGKLIYNYSCKLQQGVNVVEVNKDQWDKGLILLDWIVENKRQSQKIMLY